MRVLACLVVAVVSSVAPLAAQGRFCLRARPKPACSVICGSSTCRNQTQGRLSLGTGVGAAPGLVLTGVGGVAFVALLAIFIAGGYGA
jgi:hypothetical protein